MKQKITSLKFPILVILALAAIAVLAYAGAHAFRTEKAVETPKAETFGTQITTSFGTLTLVHKDSVTTLAGELSRSTPCVNWNAEVEKLDTGISVKITDTNKAQICVQSLGTPQTIHTVIADVVPETAYIVNLEDTTVFQGVLSPVVIPSAPTDGKAE